MRPFRRSFLLAFFTLVVCRRPSVDASSTSTFSSFSPALILPTPNSQGTPSPPSQSFSGSSSNTLSSSLTASSTPSSTPTIPPAPPATLTTSSSQTTTSTSATETQTTSSSTTSTSASSSTSQTPSPSSSSSSLPLSPNVTPATTLIVPGPDSFTTSSSSSDDPGPTTDVSSSSATSTSFWDNKSAVAGVFVTAALAGLVLVAVVTYMVFRRRQQRKLELAMEAEDFVDRGDIEDPYEIRGASPTASMTQLTTPSRVEAFVSRDIHFGANYMEFAGQGNYGLDYPPVAVPPHSAGRAGPTYLAAGNVRHQLSVGPSASGFLSAPSNSRQTPGRESVATHISYDSFYGGIDRGGYGQAI